MRGEDRVTFRVRRGDRLQIVLHRGTRVRDDAKAFVFEDVAGLLDWSPMTVPRSRSPTLTRYRHDKPRSSTSSARG
jgi:hypothetical protein